MEDNDNSSNSTYLIVFIAFVFLTALTSLSKLAAIIFCSACGVAVLVYVAFWILPYRMGPLERSICKRLEEDGYQYEKKEGDLFIIKSNSHFEVQLEESLNRRVKHLFIYYKFKDDSFEKVSLEGWSRAANLLNVRNTNTVFVALEDHLCCCYQSAIGNSKDFMDEFDIAYQSIGEVMEDYGKLVPLLERDYPRNTDNQTTIVFK